MLGAGPPAVAATGGSPDAGGHFSLRSGQLLVSAEVRAEHPNP